MKINYHSILDAVPLVPPNAEEYDQEHDHESWYSVLMLLMNLLNGAGILKIAKN